MGSLAHFDVNTLMKTWNLRHFIETGTGRGDSLAHAAKFGFDSLRSCEVDTDLHHEAWMRFEADPRVQVFSDVSSRFIYWACRMLPADQPILFWLDAHFPGADYQLRAYGAETEDHIRLPLQKELDIIAHFRPLSHDVVLVDDLRIYLDGPFQHGNLPADVRPHCPAERDTGFVREALGGTHDIVLSYDHEGYMIATPKGEN